MFQNPRIGKQARNFTTDLKSSLWTDIFRKLMLGAPEDCKTAGAVIKLYKDLKLASFWNNITSE